MKSDFSRPIETIYINERLSKGMQEPFAERRRFPYASDGKSAVQGDISHGTISNNQSHLDLPGMSGFNHNYQSSSILND